MILLKILLTLIGVPIALGLAFILIYVGMMAAIFMFLCVDDFIMNRLLGGGEE